MSKICCVIFDIGNVLVDWSPRHLYAPHFQDGSELDRFLTEIVPQSWNMEMDAGKPVSVAVEERIALYPDHADLILRWRDNGTELIKGAIEGSVEIMANLRRAHVPLYAISNYNRGRFDADRKRFAFYDWFDDIVLSGDVGLLKPDPRIYRLLIERTGLDPARSLFVDDRLENVEGARSVGLLGHQFTDAEKLRQALRASGFPR